MICQNCNCEFDYDSADRTCVQDYDFENQTRYLDKRLCCPECGSIEWVEED